MLRLNKRFGRYVHTLFSALIGTLLIVAFVPAPAYAAAGDLDPTFGNGGMVRLDFGYEDRSSALVRQPDGKLVVAGYAYFDGPRHIVLVRYNPDGTLDTSFGNGGKVVTSGVDEYASDILLLPDGKLVVAGGTERQDILLMRFNANGSIDSSFGNGGRVRTDYGGEDTAYEVVLQPDGKLVISGWGEIAGNRSMAVARYNANGSLDPTFDGDGKFILDIEGTDIAFALLLQPDGKIVAAGDARHGAPEDPIDIAMLRLNPDGSLDRTFDGDGIVRNDFGSAEWIHALTLQPDGKIVGAGTAGARDFLLIRYNADGSLDTTFGNGGKAITDLGAQEEAFSLVRQGDGKFVVFGGSGTGSYGTAMYDYAMVRYNVNGSLDTSFGNNGKVISNFGGHEQGWDILLQPDGKLVATGPIQDAFGVVRYLGDSAGLATIRIVQDAIPDNTRNYVFDSAFGAFRLDNTGTLPDDNDGVPNSMSFNVAAGSYGFSQQMVTGWRVSEIRCDRPELVTVNMSNRSVTVNAKSGDNVTCTFVTKQAVTVYARAYWDKNASRFYDVGEPWKSGVWTEIFDSAGKKVAANFTDSNGQVGAFNLAPGAYSVCQTPPSGWWNTQPGKLDPKFGKPCYSFNVAPAGLVTGYFGWIDRPFVVASDVEVADVSGLEVTIFESPEDGETGNGNLYLPLVSR